MHKRTVRLQVLHLASVQTTALATTLEMMKAPTTVTTTSSHQLAQLVNPRQRSSDYVQEKE
jgi:hypothetical protein